MTRWTDQIGLNTALECGENVVGRCGSMVNTLPVDDIHDNVTVYGHYALDLAMGGTMSFTSCALSGKTSFTKDCH